MGLFERCWQNVDVGIYIFLLNPINENLCTYKCVFIQKPMADSSEKEVLSFIGDAWDLI